VATEALLSSLSGAPGTQSAAAQRVCDSLEVGRNALLARAFRTPREAQLVVYT
jgi:hypothetical protein